MQNTIKKFGFPLAVAAVLVSAVMAAPAMAIDSLGVGARPANPDPKNPRTQSIFVYQPKKGQLVHDAVKVVNSTDKTKKISITAVDGIVSSDGAFGCAQAVEKKQDVGGWITLSKNEITLPAQGTQIVPFTMQVPHQVSPGEHNGCIAVQDVSAKQKAGNGIVLSFRSALRVAVTMPGKIVESLTFQNIKADQRHDKIILSPSLKNDGNVSLDTTLDVTLNSLFGQKLSHDSGQFPVLAHSTGTFNFEAKRPFWGGLYRVNIAAHYHQLSKPQENNNLTAHHKYIFVMPQLLALIVELIVILLLLGGIGWLCWRKLRKRKLTSDLLTYVVREGDNLQNLAQRLQMKWKALAEVNRLKPPYTLKVGQKLKVPRPKFMKKKK